MKQPQPDMIKYYAQRASEYENIYRLPERQNDLKEIESIIMETFQGYRVLEVACGTGYWTQFAAQSANDILATDYNDEVLEIASQKDYKNCDVTFKNVDAYSLNIVNGIFSAGLCTFWWSHIPRTRIDTFLRIFHSKLQPGAKALLLDNSYVEGSSTPISRTDKEKNTYQIRKLNDGSKHEVLKNFPTEWELKKHFSDHVSKFEFIKLEYYWLAIYNLKND